MENWAKLLQLVPRPPRWQIDWEALEASPLHPFFAKMSEIYQNPVWHGEGDVRTHTRMVCQELVNRSDFRGLPARQRQEVFLAALLHDIGRHEQYESGTPHEEAGAQIAPAILADCGYDEKETCVITEAIRMHRNKAIAECADLKGVLYRADKLSRPCFCCKAESACNWKEEKKNKHLRL